MIDCGRRRWQENAAGRRARSSSKVYKRQSRRSYINRYPNSPLFSLCTTALFSYRDFFRHSKSAVPSANRMTLNPNTDFDAVDGTTISPTKLAHVVFRSANYEAMRDWYVAVLGARISYEGDAVKLCLITYDDEHHRVAVIGMPHLGPQHKRNNGFEACPSHLPS